MGVKVIIQPAAPISLQEAYLHLRVIADVTDVTPKPEDTLVTGLILAAHRQAQHYTGRAIGEQTLELALDQFPAGAVELPRGSAISITSIVYIDEAGVTQTLSDTLYTLDNYDELQCWAVPKANTDWPATMAAANAVKVRYVAGDVDPAVKAAMLLTVGHLYENREAAVVGVTGIVELPLGVTAMLDTKKIWGV